jgi:predicted nuclease with TOPRIM domain
MNEREQNLRACRQNRELARENSRLSSELQRIEQECRDLTDANANLRVEVEAADILLADALDQGLSGSGS